MFLGCFSIGTELDIDISGNSGSVDLRIQESSGFTTTMNELIISTSDYVFFNPYTDQPYSYTHFFRTWYEMREKLKDEQLDFGAGIGRGGGLGGGAGQ